MQLFYFVELFCLLNYFISSEFSIEISTKMHNEFKNWSAQYEFLLFCGNDHHKGMRQEVFWVFHY